MLRSIYLGRFGLVGEGERRLAVKTRLIYAFTSYQSLWDRHCGDSSSERLREHVSHWFRVTKQGGFEISREFAYTTRVRVRARYYETYREYDDPDLLSGGLIVGLLTGGGNAEYERTIATPKDFAKAIEQLGCHTPALRQLEDNLHRLVSGEPPLQEALPWPERAPLFMDGCSRLLASLSIRGDFRGACGCFHSKLIEAVGSNQVHLLEDEFDRQSFMLLAATRVGLVDDLSACFALGGGL